MSGTFFLGLGGQKCGSSWIQAYLARQSGSDFGRLGEYQIWEHHLGGVFERYKVKAPNKVQHLRARIKGLVGASTPAAHLRWQLQSDPEAYFAYFADLLNGDGILRSGDITPSYAALDAGRVAQIQSGFAPHGIAVKAVFSMRDPVARLESHFRMELAKKRLPPDADVVTSLRAFYPGVEAEARSRYDHTLAVLEQCFAPEDRHICLFEEVFTPEGIAALSRFANVPVDADAGARSVNARAKGAPLPQDLVAEIAQHYQPVYAAVAKRLPQVAELWPSARFALDAG